MEVYSDDEDERYRERSKVNRERSKVMLLEIIETLNSVRAMSCAYTVCSQ